MTVKVLLFGAERAAAGTDALAVALDGHRTCLAVRAALERQCPALRAHLKTARFAVNCSFVPDDRAIDTGDEIALIGLVSGG